MSRSLTRFGPERTRYAFRAVERVVWTLRRYVCGGVWGRHEMRRHGTAEEERRGYLSGLWKEGVCCVKMGLGLEGSG